MGVRKLPGELLNIGVLAALAHLGKLFVGLKF
jgi:hypothetical protein